jgi:hypothetical protein
MLDERDGQFVERCPVDGPVPDQEALKRGPELVGESPHSGAKRKGVGTQSPRGQD